MYSCLCKVAKNLVAARSQNLAVARFAGTIRTGPAQIRPQQPGWSVSRLSAGDGVRLRGGFMQDAIGLKNGRPADGPPRVLVVDDDPGVRLVCTTTLRREGYDAIEAANAQEGYERAIAENRTSRCSTCRCPNSTASASRRHCSRTSARSNSGSSSPATRILAPRRWLTRPARSASWRSPSIPEISACSSIVRWRTSPRGKSVAA